jgi:hypothetical protein
MSLGPKKSLSWRMVSNWLKKEKVRPGSGAGVTLNAESRGGKARVESTKTVRLQTGPLDRIMLKTNEKPSFAAYPC